MCVTSTCTFFAFASLQPTRPQTLAHALADSPIGQLAWNDLAATLDTPNPLDVLTADLREFFRSLP